LTGKVATLISSDGLDIIGRVMGVYGKPKRG
jgi:hypothetical protein